MIERISIRGFKSLRAVDLKLGRLNLFIGSNASGKSNFFDALRVLQGIGNGFTFHEILDGKPKSATSEVWDGIRGGSAYAGWINGTPTKPIWFEVSGRFDDGTNEAWKWTEAFYSQEGRLCYEEIHYYEQINHAVRERPLYATSIGNISEPVVEVRYFGGKTRPPHLKFEKSRPVFIQVVKDGHAKWRKADIHIAERLALMLADQQRVDPSPSMLRSYSYAHEIRRMGERGENFAALIKIICDDPAAKSAYLGWLEELRPREIDDVGTLTGAVGEPLFMLKEGGRQYPAPVLSDGTLRFAAITAAFFQPDMPGLLMIEEIENGIHASRLRLLVELLRSRAYEGRTQIMATTHSPIVLAWLRPEEYSTTFFCKRDEVTGESLILPLTDIPDFNEIVKRQPISDLFAEGWLEAAL